TSVGVCFFFFSSRRRHTRFSRDWSSDVCSSDLGQDGRIALGGVLVPGAGRLHADPDEGLHLGLGYCRGAAAAVFPEHAGRPRQARVPAGRGDPLRRRARGRRAAALDRAAGLDRDGGGRRPGGLACMEGEVRMKAEGLSRSARLLLALALLALLAACAKSTVVRTPASGTGSTAAGAPGGTVGVQRGDTLYSIAPRPGLPVAPAAGW